MSRTFIVAIDGPAGAGKSTVAKKLAKRLGFALVDTGAIYRCVALEASRRGVPLDDDARLGELVAGIQISFAAVGGESRVYLGGNDVTAAIRAPEVSMGASKVSARPVVRQGLLGLQRRLALAAEQGAVLEGRDIGTVVFPDAEAKFFLDASPEVRARRRHAELGEKGVEASFEEVLADQNRRDRDDSSRELAPLRAADDAIRIDSSEASIEEVLLRLEAEVRSRMARRG
ncbi:MAG: (d)CMP kinase [Myxococcales bacterium]|nr:(d)CMP kinase [Myxococcales bacterium]